jgi:Tfp pilus assembly protein PilO
MLKSFSLSGTAGAASGTIQFRLKLACGVLAVLNAVALFLYLFPPGGTREELAQQSVQLRHRITAARLQSRLLETTSAKVQAGSSQAASFQTAYFLPKRTAYEKVIEEIQRMAKASGMQERDVVYSEEAIEGTADLSLLNATANYAGSYGNLMRFLYEADRSPMLLMLDSLNASPQPKSGEINTAIRFQAIVVEDAGLPPVRESGHE